MKDTPNHRVASAKGRTGRPRREESGEVDRKLLDTAMRMFAQYGSGIAMNAIVKESGLSRKTVYARYANKSDLLLAVVHHLLGEATKESNVITPGNSIEDALFQFIFSSLQEVCREEAVALRRIMTLNPHYLDQTKASIEHAVVFRYMEPLLTYLNTLAARGELSIDDLGKAAEALTNLILSESDRRFFSNIMVANDDDLRAHARHLTRLFCYGIAGIPKAPVVSPKDGTADGVRQ